MLEMDFIPEEHMDVKPAILKPGNATFVVKGYLDKDKNQNELYNKKGEKMMRLDLIVTDADKMNGLVYEYFTTNTQWKFKSLVDALGWPELYTKDEHGKVIFDAKKVITMGGLCTIKTFSSPGYEPKTVIDKFIRSPSPNHNRQSFAGDDDDDDGVPF
jgi:hypothetical protein